MSEFYDDYVEARNVSLSEILKGMDKMVIIKMILDNSSDEYLEHMYEAVS